VAEILAALALCFLYIS